MVESHIPIQKIEEDFIRKKGIELFLKREDLLDPIISGNKWWKLKYNLIQAKKTGAASLVTFGGAYSNHILALAAAGFKNGFETLGIIRGEAVKPLNPTLAKAESLGMQFLYLDRTSYRNLSDLDKLSVFDLKASEYYIIPEGGTNELAIKGCREMIKGIDGLYDTICCSCGTGGTIAGIISGLSVRSGVLGFSALKTNEMDRMVEELIGHYNIVSKAPWEINHDFHFGGYAKFKKELIDFINAFKHQHHIALDPIYTGKMLFGIYSLIRSGYFSKGERILAIHTGGLQGIEGFNQRFNHMLK